MFALLHSPLQRPRPGRRVARRENRPRLEVEQLEDRRVMSVVTNPYDNPDDERSTSWHYLLQP
jgi:hypothetical protein